MMLLSSQWLTYGGFLKLGVPKSSKSLDPDVGAGTCHPLRVEVLTS